MSELADAYFRWYRGDKSYKWARDRVEEIFDEDLDKAWLVTLELIDAAPSKKCLHYIAAGQLEMLLSHCGKDIIDRIKDEARHNKKLLFAMAGIYIEEKNPICAEYVSFVWNEIGISKEDMNDLVDLPED